MDNKTKNILFSIMYFLVSIVCISLIINNPQNRLKILIICIFLMISISIRIITGYINYKYILFSQIFSFVDIILIYSVMRLDGNDYFDITLPTLYLLGLLSKTVLVHSFSYSFFVLIISYFVVILSTYTKGAFICIQQSILILLSKLSMFLFIFLISYIAKYHISQSNNTTSMLHIIEEKNKKLENVYKKLSEYSSLSQKMAVIKERNRIAGEIHDTVGYTLTNVVFLLEAAKRFMKKDTLTAIEKLDTAQEQVRNGLNDIRSSVRMLKDMGEIRSFVCSIQTLIEKTENNTGITISYSIDDSISVNKDLEKLFYGCLQEGLTNGIKHGKITHFDFKLIQKEDVIQFRLKDDGIGCKKLIPSFGLLSMKEKIKSHGGNIQIHSIEGKGCTLKIQIPFKRSLKNEENQNINCR